MPNSKGTVVITGGSSGIGAGFAREFAEQGYDLLLISKDKKQMETFVKYLKVLFPIQITSLIFDLSKPAQLQQLQSEIAKIKNLEILINCAGYGINKDFLQQKIGAWEDMISVHDIASMALSYEALKIMKRRRHGIIIHVSSLASMFAIGNNPVYAASKIFLNSFSENLHRIYKDYGIYIQSLCPGFTDTNFAKSGGFRFTGQAMSVSKVVKSSLSCIKSQKIICIPGWKNKLILTLYHVLPRSRSHAIFKKLFG